MNRKEQLIGFQVCSLVVIISAFYWQDFVTVFDSVLTDPIKSYILAVPALLCYLIFRKRKVLSVTVRREISDKSPALERLAFLGGILLFAASVFLYYYGSYTFVPLEYHMLTLPIFTAGLVLILFNFNTLRQLAFPLFFMFFLAPLPAAVFYPAGNTLAVISAHVSVAIVNSLGIPSTISVSAANLVVLITKPDVALSFEIDITCSGINSFIAFSVISVFLTYLIRDKLWKKIVLVTLTLPLIYLLNILRISTLFAIGYHYGEDIAYSFFHNTGGLLLTALGAFLLVLIAQKMLRANFLKTKTLQPCKSCRGSQNAFFEYCHSCGRFLKHIEKKIEKKEVAKIPPTALIVIALILIQAPIYALANQQSSILDQLRSGQEPTTQILPQIDNYTLQFEYRDTEFEEQTNQEGTLTYSYVPHNSSKDTIYAVIEIANSQSNLHRWEYCLIIWPLRQGEQASVTQFDLRDTPIMQNPPIIARFFAFRWNAYDITQVVLYWRESLTFISNTTTEQKNMQISLNIYPEQPSHIQQTEDKLHGFAEIIANYWQPTRTWAPITLLLSKNANMLAAIPAIGLGIVVFTAVLQRNRKKAGRKIAYSKVAEQNMRILNTLSQTQIATISSVCNVRIKYKALTQEDVSQREIANRLSELSKTGLTFQEVVNVDDEPVLVWKTVLKEADYD